jgi:hypothetical protein
MYKLIKYERSHRFVKKCPYIDGVLIDGYQCRTCGCRKGETSKSIKCSFEYDHSPKSEIKTGKVTSSDCVCKEEVNKSEIYPPFKENNIMLKLLEEDKRLHEKPKVEKVKKYKYICKMCDSGKCVLIVHDTAKSSPSRFDYCPMGGDAKWKLKGEA